MAERDGKGEKRKHKDKGATGGAAASESEGAGLSAAKGGVLLPGDVVNILEDKKEVGEDKVAKKVRLGPGLRQDVVGAAARASGGGAGGGKELGAVVVASKCGVLRQQKAAYWLDANQKRAVPVLDEQVIGVITNLGENYAVDIGASLPATLSSLAFEGATKRNKPRLKIGDVVYARLTIANKDMEPEIECMDKSGKSAGMGPLVGGYLFRGSLGLCRKLLRPNNRLLQLLGDLFPFELAVGLNGRVWVDAQPVGRTVVLANAIASSEHMSDGEIDKLVKSLQGKV